MNNNIKKIGKFLFAIIVIFLVINIFMNASVFATGGGAVNSSTRQFKPLPRELATICKAIIAFTQILVTGCFTIRFTMLGIQYFTAVGANVKAATKQRMGWTLLIGVITFLAIFIFGKLIEQL